MTTTLELWRGGKPLAGSCRCRRTRRRTGHTHTTSLCCPSDGSVALAACCWRLGLRLRLRLRRCVCELCLPLLPSPLGGFPAEQRAAVGRRRPASSTTVVRWDTETSSCSSRVVRLYMCALRDDDDARTSHRNARSLFIANQSSSVCAARATVVAHSCHDGHHTPRTHAATPTRHAITSSSCSATARE